MTWKNRKRKRPKGGGVGVGNEEIVVPTNDSDDRRVEIKVVPLKQYVGDTRRIRIVKPYPYTFATFAKARWVGRSVLDVFHAEFGSYPKVSVWKLHHAP